MVCGKILHSKNKSGLCSYHYVEKWKYINKNGKKQELRKRS